MLCSNSLKPLYLQLAADIMQAIRNKKYLPGDRLPSEEELCEQYNVSRITVRKAIQELTDQNLLEKHRGKGTFVKHPERTVEISPQNGFTSYITKSGHQSRHLILTKKLQPADNHIRSLLQLQEDEPVCYVKRIIFEDEIPLAQDEIYVSSLRYPGFLDHMTNDASFYQVMNSVYHVSFAESKCKLGVSIATAAQSALLQCQTGDPLFILKKVCQDTSGQPVHYSCSIVRGDRTAYIIQTTSAETSLQSTVDL